ncbi:ATP-grasp fold amidoligase family protein [Salinarimonas ramus]|uniref:ATP-grasp fold amidoligase family protein n=1 Tax=Salinarimonas ramus TaxID=690164 RepID=UPI001669F686|nr:ATP-grasp fold amidoligase family protein [Salinarimonas ramus]
MPTRVRARLKPLLHAARRARWAIDDELPARFVVRRQYRARNGVLPNLDDPRDLSEKICWMKLYGMSDLHRRCSDKLAVRDVLAERLGAERAASLLPALLLASKHPSDLVPEAIEAESFVVKTSHDCGTVIVVPSRERFDWEKARRTLERSLRRDFSKVFKERQYAGIRPRILVEEMLHGANGGPLDDYKVFCFSGEPCLVQVDTGRDTGHRQAFYDLDWRRMPVRRHFAPVETDVARPARLDEMIDVARALSAGFPFCRVDLYATRGGIAFGELSFTPDAGLGRFEPAAFERAMGDRLDLSALRAASAGARS